MTIGTINTGVCRRCGAMCQVTLDRQGDGTGWHFNNGVVPFSDLRDHAAGFEKLAQYCEALLKEDDMADIETPQRPSGRAPQPSSPAYSRWFR